MPDAARIAQAQALEIPVTIQGAKIMDGTDRRELFTESAKTTLTFDNGAVLNLRTRVKAGQSLFLRNDQSGQEILCKVLEAPPEGEPGYTDLEFMETAPGFWEGDPEEPQAAGEKPEAAAEKSESQAAAAEEPKPAAAEPQPAGPAQPTAAPARADADAAADNSLAMMSANASEVKLPPAKVPEEEEEKPSGPRREVLVPAHEMVPETPPAPSATEPTGEQIDAALRAMAAVPAGAHDDAAQSSEANDKANLAALMAREAKLAKRAALKERAAAEIGRRPPRPKTPNAEKVEGLDGTGEAIQEEAGPPPVPLVEKLTTGKNLLYSEIVVSIAIVVAFGFIWHAVSGLFIHPSEPPVAAVPIKRPPPRAPLPVIVQTPAAPGARVSAARPGAVTRGPFGKVVRPREAPSESAPETAVDEGPRVVAPEPEVEQPKPVEPVAPKPSENIPAKIIEGSQPPIPRWAKNLDVSTVVRLDAVIDEKGNLGATRIVFGPRLLERAAEQAVQLWIFEPAQTNGKPTASHMLLTVEFKR